MNAPLQKDPWEGRERPDGVLRKVALVSARVDELTAEAVRLQASEALARVRMAAGLLEAARETAALRASLRREIRGRTRAAPAEGGLMSRLLWRLRPAILRLGVRGHARLLAASGLWRLSGDLEADLARITDYLRRGTDPDAAPDSLFDQRFYLSSYPDVAVGGQAPLLHYLLAGQFEGRDPHPLFDTRAYAERNAADIAASRLWPLAHFLAVGAEQARDPHPLFDAAYYLAQGPELAPGEHALAHYLREGWRQGLAPHPLFRPDWYDAQRGPEAAAGPGLSHYVTHGAAAGLSPHPLFDPAWYLAQADEARPADPLRHYMTVGVAQGWSPSRFFQPAYYVERRGEALPAGADPLTDYLAAGAWEVGEPAPGFATGAYLAAHPELVARRLTPLEHWAMGSSESRCPD